MNLGHSNEVFSPSIPPLATEFAGHHKVRTLVKIDPVRELYQIAIGTHLEQCQCPKIWQDMTC